MGQNVEKNCLNIGCGFKKLIGGTNVDKYQICEPDIVWDLEKTPWIWAKNNEFDVIMAHHVFEHLDDWWQVFKECARILKTGGILEIRVPDESASTALAYRDHKHIFTPYSFHGVIDGNNLVADRHQRNAWAKEVHKTVPFRAIGYNRIPFKKYNWMIKYAPWLLNFCANHMRNFIYEQIIIFERI